MLPRMQFRPEINLALKVPAVLTLYPRSALKAELVVAIRFTNISGSGARDWQNPGFHATRSLSHGSLAPRDSDSGDDKRIGIPSLHSSNINSFLGITDSPYIILPMLL
jgi:hypothetical protein